MGQSPSNLLSSSDEFISQSKTRFQVTSMGDTHPSHHHPHELELKCFKKPYTCSGCKERGFGARYRCEQCDFDLHKECMHASPVAHHDFFKNSTFKFIHEPPKKCFHHDCQRYCDACARPVQGFFYHCEEKGWDLHPFCRNLPNDISVGDIPFRLRNKVSSKCIWCKKKKLEGTFRGIRGWCYVSKSKEYLFHVHCATEMVLDGWRNGVLSSDDDTLAVLERSELPLQGSLTSNGGRGSKYIKMVKLVVKAILGILLGDPTVLLTGLVAEWVRN